MPDSVNKSYVTINKVVSFPIITFNGKILLSTYDEYKTKSKV